MLKPKGEKSSKLVNSRSARFISASAVSIALLFGAVATPISAFATDSVRDQSATTGVRDSKAFSVDKYNSLWVVVNKQRPLSYLKYVPKTLSTPPFKYPATHNPYGVQLTKDAGIALVAMAKAMAESGGGTLVASSGYRSYVTQVSVHSRQVARFGLKAGEALAARPGYSEHQTGLAVDVYAAGQACRIYTCFANTVAGKWLAKNSYKYGFIVRYQQNQAPVTGYQFEPWHLRFVGVDLAGEFNAVKAKSLEAFFKLPAAPSY